jgi:hypothetical protein
VPGVRERATCGGFLVGAEQLVEILADPRLLLDGSSAARPLEWDVPDVQRYSVRDWTAEVGPCSHNARERLIPGLGRRA